MSKASKNYFIDHTYTTLELINENQNTRSYNMNAALSNSGIAYQIKFSNSVNTFQHYIAVRQGSTTEPIGNIVISMDK